MKLVIEGRALRLRHYVGIKDIFPEKITSLSSPEQIRSLLLKGHIPESFSEIKVGDILVAGRCFGAGPYDPDAVSALRQSEIGCVAAVSFGRQFFRDAINKGLPILQQPDLFGRVKNGENLAIDFAAGEIRFRKEILKFESYKDPLDKILEAGGLIPSVKKGSAKRAG
jgi:3-isopropylmalate/(R)-2-methylmalate dehydratase small subunit